jgi:rhodanese-related sulfurtransferase
VFGKHHTSQERESLNDVRKAYEERERFQIVDVREPYEWDAGHIAEAVHIPLADVMEGRERGLLEPGRPVLVVCKVGSRSELAALMLQARGFDAQNLEGGTEAWLQAGLPLVASDGTPGKVA